MSETCLTPHKVNLAVTRGYGEINKYVKETCALRYVLSMKDKIII